MQTSCEARLDSDGLNSKLGCFVTHLTGIPSSQFTKVRYKRWGNQSSVNKTRLSLNDSFPQFLSYNYTKMADRL